MKARDSDAIVRVSGIEVRNRARAGVYDTAVIKGESGISLLNWLNQEGFSTPASAVPVIEQYASEGWVFAAAKLHRSESGPAADRPHPLAFTFKANKPVYPLRLTGIENGECTIELFVFGERRAQADRFRTEFCGAVRQYEPEREVAIAAPPRFAVGGDEVQRFALPAVIGTKLKGKLPPAEMRSDVIIDWTDFRETVPTVFGRKAAAARALNWFTALAATGMVLLQISSPGLKRPRRLTLISLIFTAALAVSAGAYAMADVKPIRTTAMGRSAAMNHFLQFAGAIERFALERNSAQPVTFEELTREIPQYLRGRPQLKNIFTGEPLRKEPTAGNMILENQTNQVQVIWFDIFGDPHRLAVFTHSPTMP